MKFADAVSAQVLWGCPVAVLDHVLELRQLALHGEISLDEWREQDAVHRSGLPAVDRDAVRRLQNDCLLLASSEQPSGERLRLLGRLTALLHPAPSDERLWEELTAVHEAVTDPQRDRRLDEVDRQQIDLRVRWLTRPGGAVDPVTGLPWSLIARYRVVDDPVLGPVPQYIDSARRLANSSASAEDRRRADLIHAGSGHQPVDRALAGPISELTQHHLTLLPRLIVDADDDGLKPLLIDVLRIWSDPRVQHLLIEETADGWPAADRSTRPDL